MTLRVREQLRNVRSRDGTADARCRSTNRKLRSYKIKSKARFKLPLKEVGPLGRNRRAELVKTRRPNIYDRMAENDHITHCDLFMTHNAYCYTIIQCKIELYVCH